MSDAHRRGRGRPQKDATADQLAKLLHLLHSQSVPFVEACKMAGTTPHLVGKVRAAIPEFDFCLRVAHARRPRRPLSTRGADWAMLAEVAAECQALEQGEEPRTWFQVQEAITLRHMHSADAAALLVPPSDILPPPRDALEAYF